MATGQLHATGRERASYKLGDLLVVQVLEGKQLGASLEIAAQNAEAKLTDLADINVLHNVEIECQLALTILSELLHRRAHQTGNPRVGNIKGSAGEVKHN